MLDLGVSVIPTAYTLRHSQGFALRNWFFQVFFLLNLIKLFILNFKGSRDGYEWNVLLTHSDDQSLSESGSTATWFLENNNKKQGSYRYFRIIQNGKNASGGSSALSLGGFELYGSIIDVVVSFF